MPLRSVVTTANPANATLVKSNARSFSVSVRNQTVLWQVNAAPMGRGENWVPLGGAELLPGDHTFSQADWEEYGVQVVHGIRFQAKSTTDPGIVSAT